MGKKPDLETKLFGREPTLMQGESLGPYTCAATDPDFKTSEIYVDTAIKLSYEDLKDRTKTGHFSDRRLAKLAIREIIDSALHELSHQYSKCDHNELAVARNLRRYPYARSYTEVSFEKAIGKILSWCL